MKTMDTSQVRKLFSRVVEAVRGGGEELVITRYGRPVAAVVRIERLSPDEKKLIQLQLGEGTRPKRSPGK